MKLIRYKNPEINHPIDEIENWFNAAFNFAPFEPFLNSRNRYGIIPVNYSETDREKYIEAEVPGVEKEDLTIELTDGILSISAKRKSGQGDKLTEFESSRSVNVGNDVDAETVKASLDNGILRLTLKRREAVLPRRIEIEG